MPHSPNLLHTGSWKAVERRKHSINCAAEATQLLSDWAGALEKTSRSNHAGAPSLPSSCFPYAQSKRFEKNPGNARQHQWLETVDLVIVLPASARAQRARSLATSLLQQTSQLSHGSSWLATNASELRFVQGPSPLNVLILARLSPKRLRTKCEL